VAIDDEFPKVLLPTDPSERTSAVLAMLERGLLTPDDARKLLGLDRNGIEQ
jgi:hypothetical protein